MPVYTYRCENCGIRFEKQQHFTDLPLTRCPECNKKTLRKVYMPVGIVFKGSGFYATDNRSPSGGGRPSSTSSEKSDEKNSEVKSDTKDVKKETSSTSEPVTAKEKSEEKR